MKQRLQKRKGKDSIFSLFLDIAELCLFFFFFYFLIFLCLGKLACEGILR